MKAGEDEGYHVLDEVGGDTQVSLSAGLEYDQPVHEDRLTMLSLVGSVHEL